MTTMNETTGTPTAGSDPTPSSSGYADVNGLHLYFEEYDERRGTSSSPLVLLHGGMLSIDLNFAELIPRLATRHRVVAVELQGHGRTADIERTISPVNSASDVVALLDHLGIAKAHVLGHSMGGAVAMELAVSYPDRVRSVVPISITVSADGMHADFSDPEKMATSTRMPTAGDMTAMKSTYQRLSPHPEHFDDFLATLSSSQEDLKGWSDAQLASVSVPVLFIIGDHDFTTIEHAATMIDKTPGSQLLVLPGTTHMRATHRVDILDPALAAFLD
jgi:pimeloyl-ACP methyl ester carboxylesterase